MLSLDYVDHLLNGLLKAAEMADLGVLVLLLDLLPEMGKLAVLLVKLNSILVVQLEDSRERLERSLRSLAKGWGLVKQQATMVLSPQT